jgi:hypothetical protein
MPLLEIPTNDDVKNIAKAFLKDLESLTVTDDATKTIKPIICSVCDSIPREAQWSTFVEVDKFIKLCKLCKLKKTDCLIAYGEELQNQYTAKDERLRDFILSPETYLNSKHEVLVCKQCLIELRKNSKANKERRRPPTESIIWGYMIRDAPNVLKSLNTVELSLITKTVTQC